MRRVIGSDQFPGGTEDGNEVGTPHSVVMSGSRDELIGGRQAE